MNYFRGVAVLVVLFSLGGCATSNNAQLFKQGQANFKVQNYHLAAQQLAPAAAAGNANAQYALGYMYYYGKGVPRNVELARGYFRQAAQQGQVQAIQSLNMIDPAFKLNPSQ